jgi:hypothetical protein
MRTIHTPAELLVALSSPMTPLSPTPPLATPSAALPRLAKAR